MGGGLMKEWLCSLAWRILWRYWPDRVYRVTYNHGTERETTTLDISDLIVARLGGATIRVYLDHAGRLLA